MSDEIQKITEQTKNILQDLFEQISVPEKGIFVLGCSSSEIMGKRIGKAPSFPTARAVVSVILEEVQKHHLFLAIQCCEHLNRALVVERECQKLYNLEEVTVIPVPTAGGSAATSGMELFKDPVVVENIQGHAGMDIGDTFIGMHLKHVVIPVRTQLKSIGQAHVTCARVRPKLIGGERAVYKKQ